MPETSSMDTDMLNAIPAAFNREAHYKQRLLMRSMPKTNIVAYLSQEGQSFAADWEATAVAAVDMYRNNEFYVQDVEAAAVKTAHYIR